MSENAQHVFEKADEPRVRVYSADPAAPASRRRLQVVAPGSSPPEGRIHLYDVPATLYYSKASQISGYRRIGRQQELAASDRPVVDLEEAGVKGGL